MKTVRFTLVGAVVFGAALPAFAGPDWQVIEHARKAKLIRMQQAVQAQRSNNAMLRDEGRQAQMMEACQQMMNGSSRPGRSPMGGK